MRTSLLEILVCPLCKGTLRIDDGASDGDREDVSTGWLVCDACPERYPIEDGIPNLLPPELRP